jgi:DNA (cytosine-5)-methyltransferase 1
MTIDPFAGACQPPVSERGLEVAGLFSGIGGLELGLHKAGHQAVLLCENDPFASKVLTAQFDAEVVGDVREVRTLPQVDLVSAGFPCQDLSQAGRTRGIRGSKSGLVGEVFRLLSASSRIDWLLLENVPFMLHLDRGEGMRYLTQYLSSEGFYWAYRIVDTRSFGIPQRRRRVLLLASRKYDPRPVLFGDDCPGSGWTVQEPSCYGFYWTEGRKGLGWAVESIPTLKCGSSVGIPSPPAVWNSVTGEVGKIRLGDAERLQGFAVDWTMPAMEVPRARIGARWRTVGNAVSVPVAKWIGNALSRPGKYDASTDAYLLGNRWPTAAWGTGGQAWQAQVSEWPKGFKSKRLSTFLREGLEPLSLRATTGFLSRARSGNLAFRDGFLDGLDAHGRLMETAASSA